MEVSTTERVAWKRPRCHELGFRVKDSGSSTPHRYFTFSYPLQLLLL